MKPASLIAQCHANISALLSHYNIPEPCTLESYVDRVDYERTQDVIDRMDALTISNRFEIFNAVQDHGETAECGWRERVARESMQVILHTNKIEVDIDRFNPNFGVAPAFCHMLECAMPGKTDPFAVARGLRKRGLDVPDMREDHA